MNERDVRGPRKILKIWCSENKLWFLMDHLTSDLLKTWGFEEYISQFRDGRVDSGTLRILTDDEICQLVPVPGDRARFKMNLNNWKRELADLNRNTEPGIDFSSFEQLKSSELPSASVSFGTLLRNTIDITDTTDVSLFDNLIAAEGTTSSPVTQSSDSDVIHYSNPIVSVLSPLPPRRYCPTEEREHLYQDKAASPSSDGTVQCGYVLKTLQSSIDGRALLRKREQGKLEENQRNILVKLLLQPIFEKDPNVQITNKQLLSWSLEIQDIFIKESAALYYTPYVSAHVQTTARNASGKLLRFVYNKRQQLRSRGIIERARSRSSTRSSSSASSNSEVAPLIRLPAAYAESDEELKDKLTWLRISLEPWHLVEEKWAATAALRINTNYLAGSSLQEYFKEYPVLKSPTGYELLLADFQVLYGDKTDGLFTKLITLREKVIEVARNKLNNIRDKDVKQSLELYLTAISEAEGSEVKNNGVLMLLPYITSSVPLKEKKKLLWKPSKSEVRDGFITQIGADSELKPTIESRKLKLDRYGKTLQPFVIFVGPSIGKISHCYVIVGDTYYKINKLVNAVDTCFKIIHATGAKYQSEAIVVWMVVQKAFYNIITPYDKDLITVKSLLIDLGI